jgi:hypothetical protein
LASAGDGTRRRADEEPSPLKSKRPTPDDRKAAAKRAALRALKKARRAAETAGVKLSDWEGEFLGSVEERVSKYGRAFHDPEKGHYGSSLSVRQAVKLKEIAGKASGKKPSFRR